MRSSDDDENYRIKKKETRDKIIIPTVDRQTDILPVFNKESCESSKDDVLLNELRQRRSGILRQGREVTVVLTPVI